MDIVVGISQNQLAHLVTDRGVSENLAVSHLRTRGVPIGPLKDGLITTNFDTWRLLDGDAASTYPEAFGIRVDMSAHQVFEFMSGKFRYVVPALAVIRALIKNKASLMRGIFRPQGVDEIITPVLDEAGLSACLIPESARQHVNNEFLIWLYGYPSCRKMFQSVFQNAQEGRIGVSLPIGTVEVRPKYSAKNQRDKTRYVTEISIIGLTTTERPLECYQIGKSEFLYHRAPEVYKAQLFNEEIPLRPNSQEGLSDGEWMELQPILKMRCSKHDPRLLLDGVLHKLVCGKPWRECTFPLGTWSNASNLYQGLIKNGKWPQVMAVLRNHRYG